MYVGLCRNAKVNVDRRVVFARWILSKHDNGRNHGAPKRCFVFWCVETQKVWKVLLKSLEERESTLGELKLADTILGRPQATSGEDAALS